MRKRALLFAGICLAIGLAPVPLLAQTGGVQAKIPFNFVVSDKLLPAGNYTMTANSGQIRIQDSNGRMITMVMANQITGRSTGANGEIVFHCYGERCFLSEMWSPLQENGRQVITSKTEVALANEERGKLFAVLGEKPRK